MVVAARVSTRRRIRPSGSARMTGPAAKLENEKPQGETISYDELVQRWQQK